ncbi:hypothetical protein F4780DRAFT_794773 [Xylariomycetidae sp. FL0641]|nr:hypothetical protein F4780DRAFT_794773 [Xylariomycetidae sp. FL0641]
MASPLVIFIAVIAVAYTFLYVLLYATQHTEEPPTVGNNVPFLSPVIGMVTKKAQYHRRAAAVRLFRWIRHEFLIATTEGVYGPRNPYRDPAMEQAWYKFEPRIMTFALQLFPGFFAKEALDAREYMVESWKRYFGNATTNRFQIRASPGTAR